VVFREPLVRHYSSSWFSAAFVFRVFIILCALFLPYVISYLTGAFWLKEAVYREQPRVAFKHELIVVVEGAQPGTYFLWSTIPELNQESTAHLRVPQVRAREQDINSDGLNDDITIEIDFPLQSGDFVHRIAVVSAFSYKLSGIVSLNMEGLCILDHTSPLPGTALYVYGELRLRQQVPLAVGYTITPPLLLNTNGSLEDLMLPSLVAAMTLRNVTTECVAPHPVWVSGVGPLFTLTLFLRIPPEESIIYRPPVYEVLKFSWIQYLSALIFILVILYYFQLCVFRLHILPTTISTDGQPKQPLFKKIS